MAGSSITKITLGGSALQELPGQEDKCLQDKYFDEFSAEEPFEWKGSRRLTKDELKEFGL